MSTIHIRAATLEDLPAIEVIEKSCFHADLRVSPRALRYSFKSPIQSVWVAVGGQNETIGAMVLYHHPRSIRIFSIAVLPAFRGSGAGRQMMEKALSMARHAGCDAVTLEAELSERKLISWYENFGFEIKKTLIDYHSSGRHAVRMRLALKPALKGGRVCGRS
ncbi:MAG TPA: N-acetyltransferase [Pontiellaceae bacterium]|nr:N-acetyltransferase [Pontiellaceae bacterium]HPR83215.1 N-acetyltransferase [Pontiellaceae bacterium]